MGENQQNKVGKGEQEEDQCPNIEEEELEPDSKEGVQIFGKVVSLVHELVEDKTIGATQKQLLCPIIDVLNVCLEQGADKAQKKVLRAVFKNINAQKMIPLMASFNGMLFGSWQIFS
jgi:hypothetical protein